MMNRTGGLAGTFALAAAAAAAPPASPDSFSGLPQKRGRAGTRAQVSCPVPE